LFDPINLSITIDQNTEVKDKQWFAKEPQTGLQKPNEFWCVFG
jgi:hypothetical protein